MARPPLLCQGVSRAVLLASAKTHKKLRPRKQRTYRHSSLRGDFAFPAGCPRRPRAQRTTCAHPPVDIQIVTVIRSRKKKALSFKSSTGGGLYVFCDIRHPSTVAYLCPQGGSRSVPFSVSGFCAGILASEYGSYSRKHHGLIRSGQRLH